MPVARVCTEDGVSLAGRPPHAKTCCKSCRQKRARRIRREKREAGERMSASSHVAVIRDSVDREASDEIKKVLHEELRPIVREALTEDTMRAVQKLLRLTTKAVDALGEDLESEDAVIRQRASSLIVKYTIGHPALVKSDDADGSKQIVVNFALPRPDSAGEQPVIDAEAVKTCDLCGEEKPEQDFVAGSDRCQPCADEWKRKITEQFS